MHFSRGGHKTIFFNCKITLPKIVYQLTQKKSSTSCGTSNPVMPWYKERPVPTQNIPTPEMSDATYFILLYP